MPGMLDDVEEMTNEGHHFTVFVSDVAVLAPEKFEIPLDDSAAQ
jgi:hypothetical protein